MNGLTNIVPKVVIDDALDGASTNPVENRVIVDALDDKQGTLVSGVNIKTINSLSILGSGDIEVSGVSQASMEEYVAGAIASKADKATTLSGYGITDAYTQTSVDSLLADKADASTLASKADKATTVSGYGITDAYTKTEVGGLLADKADVSALDSKANVSSTLSGYGINDAYTKTAVDNFLSGKASVADLESLSGVVDDNSSSISSIESAKADKSTTLSGYGITDAYTKAEVDSKLSSAMTYKGSVATVDDLPSSAKVGDIYTVEETGTNYAWDGTKWNSLGGAVDLSDYYTKGEVDGKLSSKANSATSLSGYGITDAYTKTQIDTNYLKKVDADATYAKPSDVSSAVSGLETEIQGVKSTANSALTTAQSAESDASNALSQLAGKADKSTSLSGYGISDAYTKTEVDTKLSSKANTANTLGGYGIVDAYTKEEVNTSLSGKANVSTTLSGYGITDAYTKAEVDSKIKSPLVVEVQFKKLFKPVASSPYGAMGTWDAASGIVSAGTVSPTDILNAINSHVLIMFVNSYNDAEDSPHHAYYFVTSATYSHTDGGYLIYLEFSNVYDNIYDYFIPTCEMVIDTGTNEWAVTQDHAFNLHYQTTPPGSGDSLKTGDLLVVYDGREVPRDGREV